VHDREPVIYSAFFTASSATKVALQVFANAWYIVQTQPFGAPPYLGMPRSLCNFVTSLHAAAGDKACKPTHGAAPPSLDRAKGNEARVK
jgi:hypothetical protein